MAECNGRQNPVRRCQQFHPAQMEAFRRAAATNIQSPYNLFEREIEGTSSHTVATRALPRSLTGRCAGVSSGRMTAQTKFEGDDLQKVDPKFRAPRFERSFEWSGSSVRPSQLRKTRPPSGFALGPRPAGLHDRALGRAA